jgi:hypothetical protein
MKDFLILFLIGLNLSLANQNISKNHSITVTAESRNDYTLSGTDKNGTLNGNDPELVFKIGSKIDFIIDDLDILFF